MKDQRKASKQGGGGSPVYGLGFIGAVAWFWKQADEPLAVLGLASSLLAAFDERVSPTRRNEPSLPSRDDLVQSFSTSN